MASGEREWMAGVGTSGGILNKLTFESEDFTHSDFTHSDFTHSVTLLHSGKDKHLLPMHAWSQAV